MSKIEQFESTKKLAKQVQQLKLEISNANERKVTADVTITIFVDSKRLVIPSEFQRYINAAYSKQGDILKSINDAANAMLSDLDTLRQQAIDEFNGLVGP